MSTLNYYTITLTPEDRFFFGGEIAFGQDGDDDRRRSYLIRSRILPQQTSLLGMLRYELLRHNKLLAPYAAGDKRKQPAVNLVGAEGFSTSHTTPYGKIDAISPLLISDGDRLWQPRPLDDAKGEKDEENLPLQWHRVADRYWRLDHYNPKDELTTHFVSQDGADQRQLSKCFAPVSLTGNRISNRRSRPGETSEEDEEGLFRQTFRKNTTGKYAEERSDESTPAFSFVFRVSTDGDLFQDFIEKEEEGAVAGAKDGRGSRVFLGGERSTFRMHVERAADLELVQQPTYRTNTHTPENAERVVFTSDVFLPEPLLTTINTDHRYFLLGHVKTFRFLSSPLDNVKQFASLSPAAWNVKENAELAQTGEENQEKVAQTGRRTESKPYQFLERGGVIIVPAGQGQKVVTQIKAEASFHRIGYNHCSLATALVLRAPSPSITPREPINA